jgi:hypothetical protein
LYRGELLQQGAQQNYVDKMVEQGFAKWFKHHISNYTYLEIKWICIFANDYFCCSRLSTNARRILGRLEKDCGDCLVDHVYELSFLQLARLMVFGIAQRIAKSSCRHKIVVS